MRVIIFPIVLLVAATQTGCIVISNPSYPKEWASVEGQPEICTVLPGNYLNSGKAGEQGKGAPPLVALLFREAKPATNVRIQKKAETTFLLESEASGAIVNSRTIEAKCGATQLTIPPEEPEGFVNREGVVGYQYDSTEVRVSKDGALVVRTTTGGFGIMLLVPAGGFESRWFHYPNAEGAGLNEKP